MQITTSITVPHYVYSFYQKIAENLDGATTEAVMADALLRLAGELASTMLQPGAPS